MEKLLPPGFFTIMVHLVTHLETEAKLVGPVHYRWMYPIERYLGTLKSYVRNCACPEDSIAEAYIANECLAFCSRYLDGGDSRSYCSTRCNDENENETSKDEFHFPTIGESCGAIDVYKMDEKTLLQAHQHMLFNCESEVVESYKNEWFKEQVKELEVTSDIIKNIKALAKGSSYIAKRFNAYDVYNGYRFLTKQSIEYLETQNSGVMVVSKNKSYASSSDNAPKFANISYYGKLNDIME
ncbi:hypothetical protein KY285_030311 [Solanum tuberosum]|nr:hypothetical protein KY285_030311 [Solanum tuberosum]